VGWCEALTAICDFIVKAVALLAVSKLRFLFSLQALSLSLSFSLCFMFPRHR
jgi:hypothetical protein